MLYSKALNNMVIGRHDLTRVEFNKKGNVLLLDQTKRYGWHSETNKDDRFNSSAIMIEFTYKNQGRNDIEQPHESITQPQNDDAHWYHSHGALVLGQARLPTRGIPVVYIKFI